MANNVKYARGVALKSAMQESTCIRSCTGNIFKLKNPNIRTTSECLAALYVHAADNCRCTLEYTVHVRAQLTGRLAATADLFILFMFSIGRNNLTFPSGPR